MSSAAAPDLKAAVKAVQTALGAGKPAEAVSVATPLLSAAGALEAAVEKDVSGKQRAQAYTLCAFAGLAHAQLRQTEQAETCYLRATRIQEDQFPAWKGLFDLYSQQGSAAKDKLRGVLEKLTPLAPPYVHTHAFACSSCCRSAAVRSCRRSYHCKSWRNKQNWCA
jgi:tetratricopeptide (TPR) repeat protein